MAVAAATPVDGNGFADIIVTATKRETNLQHTPVSISVLSAQSIADHLVQSRVNLMDGGTPSLRIATFEARQSVLTVGIRGIVIYDANQTMATVSPSIATASRSARRRAS